MSLFETGQFTLHSGDRSGWRINCEQLSDADLKTLAVIAVPLLPLFNVVVSVPSGGDRLAEVMRRYRSMEGAESCTLVVDDVLTTGLSLEQTRSNLLWHGRTEVQGLVIFARGPCPKWVTPLFLVNQPCRY